jgi:hypothetical protein
MANVSGLQLLKPEERNALLGTTYGTGQLIAAALDQVFNPLSWESEVVQPTTRVLEWLRPLAQSFMMALEIN